MSPNNACSAILSPIVSGSLLYMSPKKGGKLSSEKKIPEKKMDPIPTRKLIILPTLKRIIKDAAKRPIPIKGSEL